MTATRDLTATGADHVGGPATDLEPGLRHQVTRRARLLCRNAEPHASEVPCPAHLQEAHRQLLEAPV